MAEHLRLLKKCFWGTSSILFLIHYLFIYIVTHTHTHIYNTLQQLQGAFLLSHYLRDFDSFVAAQSEVEKLKDEI